MKPINKEYVKLNKNILIAFAASIIISAIVAQLLSEQEPYLNTTFTLFADYATYFSVFGLLYYLDNRKKYKLKSGETNWPLLKGDLIKIISSLGIAEAVYTVVRWSLQYYLLIVGYDAYVASVVSQLISTTVYVIVMNVSVKITRLYKDVN